MTDKHRRFVELWGYLGAEFLRGLDEVLAAERAQAAADAPVIAAPDGTVAEGCWVPACMLDAGHRGYHEDPEGVPFDDEGKTVR